MPYIEVLVDTSGSMGTMKGTPSEDKYLLPDGNTRMTVVKRILIQEILPTLNYVSKVVIRTFKGSNDKEQKPIVEEIYNDGYNISLLSQKINSLPDDPIGGTPITAAINQALLSLKGFQDDADKKIILITDGGENKSEDYSEAVIKTLASHGNFCKIFIIGIYQDTVAEQRSSALSALTNGLYKNLKPKSLSDFETIRNELIAIKNVIKEVKKQPINELERKSEEQNLQIEKLHSEIEKLKEQIRVKYFLGLEIDSTTLTIDTEYSEAIRQKSEKFLYEFLCDKFGATKVTWVNQKTESFIPHDFELLDENGKIVQLIECKGTAKDKPTFYLTAKEWNYFLEHKELYQVYRVFNVDGEMNAVCIDNLLASLLDKRVVPYLLKIEILKEGRVFLTLRN